MLEHVNREIQSILVKDMRAFITSSLLVVLAKEVLGEEEGKKCIAKIIDDLQDSYIKGMDMSEDATLQINAAVAKLRTEFKVNSV